jgi:hypothetical protein
MRLTALTLILSLSAAPIAFAATSTSSSNASNPACQPVHHGGGGGGGARPRLHFAAHHGGGGGHVGHGVSSCKSAASNEAKAAEAAINPTLEGAAPASVTQANVAQPGGASTPTPIKTASAAPPHVHAHAFRGIHVAAGKHG